MKTYLNLLVILIMVSSCQEKKKDDMHLESITKSRKISQKNNVSKDEKSVEFPSEAHFEAFFPKSIGPYNLINIGVSETIGVGSGTYIKGKDYGNSMTYIVTDGYRKGSAAIRNFEGSYQSNQDWPEGTELISQERDGFKTVALLRHNYNNYKVSTLYDNRFVLTVEGHEKPDELWGYLKQADMKRLDTN